ncbi:hypothetical protein [Sulfurimonas paralvinellae]|uniref:hypothetical protein n=1 Tax=Sulfurimonas paralvinellae TaxID=317658 RepID=UPI001868F4DC|nr:hypothetical protein [Sulfurimonas paralvinellae]
MEKLTKKFGKNLGSFNSQYMKEKFNIEINANHFVMRFESNKYVVCDKNYNIVKEL